jgi:hypothetical protein
MLWAAIFPVIDIERDPAREVIRRSIEQYVRLVDEHPNVCRFLIQGRFAEQTESTMRALNEGREVTLALANIFSNELRDMELDSATIELAAYTTFGSAAAASDWWLGPEVDSPRRMPAEEFVEHMTTIMLGSIKGTCEMLGIKIDAELPLHEGVQRREPVG